jgi:hypothetical protein
MEPELGGQMPRHWTYFTQADFADCQILIIRNYFSMNSPNAPVFW